jgi:hypothetical protein
VADAVDACPDIAAAGRPYGCPASTDASTPTKDTLGPTITLPASDRLIAASQRGVVQFRIGPSVEDCTGVLAMKTAEKVKTSRNARSRVLRLGSKPFRVEAGQATEVKITLPAIARNLLHKTGQIRSRATITLRDAMGNTTTRQYSLSIRATARR